MYHQTTFIAVVSYQYFKYQKPFEQGINIDQICMKCISQSKCTFLRRVIKILSLNLIFFCLSFIILYRIDHTFKWILIFNLI